MESTTHNFDIFECNPNETPWLDESQHFLTVAYNPENGLVVNIKNFRNEDYRQQYTCILCLQEGMNDEYGALRVQGNRSNASFVHVNNVHHKVQDLWLLQAYQVVDEYVRSDKKFTVISEPNDIVNGNYEVYAESGGSVRGFDLIKNPVELSYLKNKIGEWTMQDTIGTFFYPSWETPPSYLKKYMNLEISAPSFPFTLKTLNVGIYVVPLTVTDTRTNLEQEFLLRYDDAMKAKVRVNGSMNHIFSNELVHVMRSPITNWSMQESGLFPSWGSAAFDIDKFLTGEFHSFQKFFEIKHLTKPTGRVLRGENSKGVSLPKNTFQSTESVTNAPSKPIQNNPLISNSQFKWFVNNYFTYSSNSERDFILLLADKINLNTMAVSIDLNDMKGIEITMEQSIDVVMSNDVLWNPHDVLSNDLPEEELRIFINPEWIYLISDLVQIHKVSKDGTSNEKLNLKKYVGKPNPRELRWLTSNAIQ